MEKLTTIIKIMILMLFTKLLSRRVLKDPFFHPYRMLLARVCARVDLATIPFSLFPAIFMTVITSVS